MTIQNSQHIDAIHDIRQMMKKSTRFLSLSGLSGVFAGIYALVGAALAYLYLKFLFLFDSSPQNLKYFSQQEIYSIYFNLSAIALGILLLSVLTAWYFSNKKAKSEGLSLFDYSAIRAFINLCIPLFAGGIFCIALLYHGSVIYIVPAMLLFYGLALINASKYTYDDIRYFGICEIVLGLISSFDLGNGLIYWAIGFGILHIIYGAVMWYKYERKDKRE